MCIRDSYLSTIKITSTGSNHCYYFIGSVSVSYTHLDVYKRQVLYNSGTYAKNYLILFEFAALIVCHRKYHFKT